MRTASIFFFTALTLQSVVAHAQEDDEWFGGEEQAAEAAPAEEASSEEAPAEEASSEEAPASDTSKSGAKPTRAAPNKVELQSDDPVRDHAAETPSRKGVRTHDGFYLRLSIGGGSLAARGQRYDASDQSSEYEFEGNAVYSDIMIGGSPMPGLALGGAYLGGWAARARETRVEGDGGDSGMSFGLVGPFVDIYPNPHGGFHLGGMMGPAAAVTYDDRYEERTAAMGFGAALWVGYDFWVSDQWSLGGVLRAAAARVETPPNRDLAPEEDRLGIGSVALLISATYH